MASRDSNDIVLRLEGSRARRGVTLSDFEGFIEHFLAALRDFDRDRRGMQTRRPGHPERRAEAVTAFRLLRFEPGSGIATITPDVPEADAEPQMPIADDPLALTNLHALVDGLAHRRAMPPAVTDALVSACRTFGAEGSISIALPERLRPSEAVIDLPTLERGAAPAVVAPEEITSISGRLHLLDVEPDKLAIRTTDGTDWTCRYAAELESTVTALVGQVVWAEGGGRRTSPGKGVMDIDHLQPLDHAGQTALFTFQPVADSDLRAHQGIHRAQGLTSFAAVGWDDENDDPYLIALLGK